MGSTISIRLDKETEELLETLSALLNLKRSQLLRRAFKEWAKTREKIYEQNMMLCENLLIASLLEPLEDDEITHVASLMADLVTSKIRMRQIKDNVVNEPIHVTLEHFTASLSPEKFGWFDDINFSHHPNNHITIYGFHSLNLQYSRYAVKLMTFIFSKTHSYQSDATTQTMTENSFIVRLKPS